MEIPKLRITFECISRFISCESDEKERILKVSVSSPNLPCGNEFVLEEKLNIEDVFYGSESCYLRQYMSDKVARLVKASAQKAFGEYLKQENEKEKEIALLKELNKKYPNV